MGDKMKIFVRIDNRYELYREVESFLDKENVRVIKLVDIDSDSVGLLYSNIPEVDVSIDGTYPPEY